MLTLGVLDQYVSLALIQWDSLYACREHIRAVGLKGLSDCFLFSGIPEKCEGDHGIWLNYNFWDPLLETKTVKS